LLASQAITWGPNRLKAERATRSGEARGDALLEGGPCRSTPPHAARAVFHLIDRKPLIDSASESGERPAEDAELSLQLPGPIEFRGVHFAYPSRPHVPVLRGLSLSIRPGQKVALVGPSGCGESAATQRRAAAAPRIAYHVATLRVPPRPCLPAGKSTVIQLLERFYDPAQGSILLAGRPLPEYHIGWLRERMGLISQEPVLFGDSIRYNGAFMGILI